MTSRSEVAAQLADELGAAVYPLAALAGPHEIVAWGAALTERAPLLAAQLCQDDDNRLAAQTAIDVMRALWPHGDPEAVGSADWWRTPLGVTCARVLSPGELAPVTRAVAAAILGVTVGTVQQLVHRGSLSRHPEGGIKKADALARVVRLRGTEPEPK